MFDEKAADPPDCLTGLVEDRLAMLHDIFCKGQLAQALHQRIGFGDLSLDPGSYAAADLDGLGGDNAEQASQGQQDHEQDDKDGQSGRRRLPAAKPPDGGSRYPRRDDRVAR